MTTQKILLLSSLTFLLFLLFPTKTSAATITVNSGGSITNAINSANPGDTILVQNGTYSGFTVNSNGNSGAYITVKAVNKWGAKITGSVSDGIGIEFGNSSYIRIEGLDISGFRSGLYSNQTASHLQIVGNHFHDLGRECSDSDYGNDGMYLHGISDITVDGNIFNNIGRYANGENGCQNSTNNYQNHDHPIYVDGVNTLTIKNNIFYNNHPGWDVHIYSSSGLTSSNVNIVNNTFAFQNPWRNGQVILAGNLSNATIANNIFYSPANSAISVSPANFSNVNVTKNLATVGSMIDNSSSGISVSSNLTNTNPQLVNPNNFDFHLTSTSPAINAGSTYSYVTTDFDGNSRPQGSSYDIGAYEYTGVAGTPAPTPISTPVSTSGELPCDGSAGVYLYSDTNYIGNCSRFTSTALSLSGTTVGNDSLSSVKIVGSFTATIYSDNNLSGVNSTTATSVPNMSTLAVGNDSASSVLVTSSAATTAPTPAGNPQPIGPGGSWNMIFNDEFNGTSLDPTKWSECYPWDCHTGGNGELMVYTTANNIFDGSTLSERATNQQTCSGSYCANYGSSLIQTGVPIGGSTPKFTFQYGFAEAKLQVPYGTGYFPAFWMLGPTSEIDLMEVFGNTTNFSCGVHLGHYTSKWGCNTHGGNTLGSWHTFGVDWEPTYINFYYDGNVVGTTTNTSQIPAEQMYILLNFAIGANFIPAPDSTTVFPAYFRSDYVRVWQHGSTSPSCTLPAVAGDTNADGKINGLDYISVLNHFNQVTTLGPSAGDVDCSGTVDAADLSIVVSHLSI